jgi:hypothetical protein
VTKRYCTIFDENINLEFISYLLQKDANFNLKGYLNFLKESKKLITHVDTIENRRYLTNLKSVSLLVAEKFRGFKKLCSNCNPAFISLIDYIIFEHINTIETIFDGKQICNLAGIVDKYLNYNSDTANDLITNGQFQLVESEKKAFIHEIEAAGVLINKLYEQEITEMEKSLDLNLKELVAKSINMRQVNSNNVDKLNRMHAEVNSAMKAKVAFGVINTIGLISSILFPSAAVLTQTVTGVAGSAMSTDGNYQKHQSLVAEGMQNAKKLLARFANKTKIELSTVTSALHNVTDFEKEGEQFLSEKKRKNAFAILEEPQKIFSIDTANLLISLNDEVKARIDNLAQSDGNVVNIKRLEKLNTGLKVAANMAGASIEVVNTVTSFLHDQSALSQIEATILANQVALKDLAEYEKVIQTKFGPVLQEMIATFERKKLEIKTSNDFEREFQKLNLKKYARECISLVNKVTEGFDDDNSFAGIITDLQDFMTTVIDIYDKISEYEHRARLANFIGQMNGGQCSDFMSNDPEACTLFLSASAEIDGTKLNKNFVHIFRAHQQVMFPYGGEQMHLLSSSISTLLQEPLMKLPDKIKLLHKALTTIKDQLTEDDHTIMEDKDRFIFFAQFNSYFKSRSPFYVWPGSKFGAQIKKLLSGEQVNFAASVLQPRIENAVKFKTIMLNVTSRNPANVAIVQDLLRNFNVEMMHGGESYYKCGTRFYSIPGERQLIEMSFERDNRGDLVSVNRVYEKLKYGDVPMSPYTSWRFQLKCVSKEKTCPSLFNELSSLAHEVDLELVGSGYFLKEDAPICETDLSLIYSSFAMSIL